MRTKFPSRAIMRWSVLAMAALTLCGPGRAGLASEALFASREAPFVCAQVVLAIDGSESTRDRAFRRQIESLRAAFGREQLYHAIQDCLPGSVAFAAITWSGVDQQDLCVDWSLVTAPDDGRHLAERFDRCKYFGGSTNIGRAVDYGLQVLDDSPFTSYYRIVFVLTNGRNDHDTDASLSAARAKATASSVTLAGYALLRPQSPDPSPFIKPDPGRLARYVAKQVSAGPRSFTAYSHPPEDIDSVLRALVEMLRQEAG